jgi:DNA modification methylase
MDSCVTDSPYGIRFMGHKWDYEIPSVEFWTEVFRVLKPGGHLLCFCGTRTQHRMVVNIEDAGFEIRDVISWIYGQGFPKSLNISKQIDAQILCGNGGTRKLREVEQAYGDEKYTLKGKNNRILGENRVYDRKSIEPQTLEAKEWKGWGTALKPACEFITMARKPISEKNVALNILKWRTGGINIDKSRIEINGEIVPINKLEDWSGFGQIDKPNYTATVNETGRFPANLLLDEEAGKLLDAQSGISRSPKTVNRYNTPSGSGRYQLNFKKGPKKSDDKVVGPGDIGGASRFFYCAKPSEKEKGGSTHPTIKPLKLMRYLVNLVTPPEGIVLDPFMGSGTTGMAAKLDNFSFIGIDISEDYVKQASQRISNVSDSGTS